MVRENINTRNIKRINEGKPAETEREVIMGVENWQNDNNGNLNNVNNNEEERIIEKEHEERGRETEKEDMREIKIRFDENLKSTSTTHQNIQERQQLLKLKKSVKKTEIGNANKILERLRDTHDICNVVDAV